MICFASFRISIAPELFAVFLIQPFLSRISRNFFALFGPESRKAFGYFPDCGRVAAFFFIFSDKIKYTFLLWREFSVIRPPKRNDWTFVILLVWNYFFCQEAFAGILLKKIFLWMIIRRLHKELIRSFLKEWLPEFGAEYFHISSIQRYN